MHTKELHFTYSLEEGSCGVEPEVTASLYRQTNAEMATRSNRAICENGCLMERLRRTSEMVRGRMEGKPYAHWNI